MNDNEVRKVIWSLLANLKSAGVKERTIFVETMFSMTCMALMGSNMDVDKTHTLMSYAVSKDMIEAARDDILDQMEIN